MSTAEPETCCDNWFAGGWTSALEQRGISKVEREVLQSIGAILRDARRMPRMTATLRTIIVLERRPARL